MRRKKKIKRIIQRGLRVSENEESEAISRRGEGKMTIGEPEQGAEEIESDRSSEGKLNETVQSEEECTHSREIVK